MERQNKKFSTSVLALSIICALLCGFILGYFTSNFLIMKNLLSFPSSPVTTCVPEKYDPNARKDIIYFSPGNEDLWKDSYKQISEGEGLINGKIFIDDKPAIGLEFSLILASGQKTQKSTVKEDGSYVINIPRGKYYLNGLLIYNNGVAIGDKFLINRISIEEGMSLILSDINNKALQDEYSKLEKRLGAKEAAEKLFKNLTSSSPFRDRFPFEVGDRALEFPDFHYRDPLRLILPAANSTVTLDGLKFIWQPIAHAAYYKLHVSNIEKEGTTTSYHPAISHNFIKENQISYRELLTSADKPKLKEKCRILKNLEPRKFYGYRVVAYDNNNQIITASGIGTTDLSIFSVKEKP